MLFINDIVIKNYDEGHKIDTVEIILYKAQVNNVLKKFNLIEDTENDSKNRVIRCTSVKGVDWLLHIADNNYGLNELLKYTIAQGDEIKLLPLNLQRHLNVLNSKFVHKDPSKWIQHVLYCKMWEPELVQYDREIVTSKMAHLRQFCYLHEFNSVYEVKKKMETFSFNDLLNTVKSSKYPLFRDFVPNKTILSHTFSAALFNRKLSAAMEYLYVHASNEHILPLLKEGKSIPTEEVYSILDRSLMEVIVFREYPCLSDFMLKNIVTVIDSYDTNFIFNIKQLYKTHGAEEKNKKGYVL